LFDSNDLVKLIKKASVDAVNASKPANIVFGKVISESPLKIKIDQKLILTTAQLVLSRDVTDYEIEIEPSLNEEPYFHLTEETSGGTEAESFESHVHEYKGRKKFLVYNALKMDEEVILMQVSGGQKYVVIDRIGKV
jgi:hypothetical protein